jgi:hypothetical protein
MIDEDSGAGTQILFRKLPFGFKIGYLPKGPVGVPQNIQFWNEVHEICVKRKTLFLKIELDIWDSSSSFEQVPHSLIRWIDPIR